MAPTLCSSILFTHAQTKSPCALPGNLSCIVGAIEMENHEVVEPRKATFYVSEDVQTSVLKRRRGIACSVFFNGETVLLTSSSVVGAKDKQKKFIAERFSSSHVGNHRLDVSFDRQLGNFTFLKIDKEHSDGTGRSWRIYVSLESATHEKKGLAKTFYEQSQFKLQFEGVGSSTTIKVISRSTIETTSIIGAPIIIENRQVKKKHSGRFSVIGVVGLTSKEKLCPCYWDDNTRVGEFCFGIWTTRPKDNSPRTISPRIY